MKHLFVLITCITLMISGCGSETVTADLVDIQNDLATFKVENNTGETIKNITFEITYYNAQDLLIIDTVFYKTSGQPYAKPGESTHFAQKTPSSADDASVRILSFND